MGGAFCIGYSLSAAPAPARARLHGGWPRSRAYRLFTSTSITGVRTGRNLTRPYGPLRLPRWIMDGNYSGTLAARLSRADTIVFLDMPTALCLWRVLCRTLRHIGRTRDDMAKGC